MGATLSTLRKYVRAEVNDPAPERLPDSSTTFTHDGGNNLAYFEDNNNDFYTTHGIRVGDVVVNTTDGGSLAVIQQITNGGGAQPTNARLVVGSIEGGTDNDYDNDDVIQIWSRHAQKGLDGTRWTDSEVNNAITQAQKIVALRFGGVEKYSVHQDIKVMSKIDIVSLTGTFQVAESISGGTNSHQATIEYVGDDFLVVSRFVTRVPIDGVSGTFLVGETVTGGTNSYTGIVKVVNANYLDLYAVSGEFADDETLTGGTSSATASVNSASSYSSGLFAANEELTGGTSAATAKVKAAYTANNFYVGQDMPADLKHLIVARWWDGSQFQPLYRDSVTEYSIRPFVAGDPMSYHVFGVDQLTTDATPQKKIWLWPNNAAYQYNELHLYYMAWDRSLTGDTITTNFDYTVERLLVLEAAKILVGPINEEALYKRILTDIQSLNTDILGTEDNETDRVGQVIDWNADSSPFLLD